MIKIKYRFYIQKFNIVKTSLEIKKNAKIKKINNS